VSAPSPGLLDPLDGWPRIDPRADYVRESMSDLDGRVAAWTEAGTLLVAARDRLAADRGPGVEAARERTNELATAIAGLAEPYQTVAAVLDAYLSAHERYAEQMTVASDLAHESVVEVIAMRQLGQIDGPLVPLTPLRERAWAVATEAMDDLATAGLQAAAAVEIATQLITSGSIDTGRACRPAGVFDVLIEGGEVTASVNGSVTAIRAGFQALVLQRAGLLTAEDLQRIRSSLTIGGTTLSAADGRLRVILGVAAARAHVGEGAYAMLGIAAGISRAGVLAVGDAVTVIGGTGESGAHDTLSRTAAAANGVAGVQLAVEAFGQVGIRALGAVALPVFFVTSVYQLGDLAYTNRRWLVGTAEGFAGHPTAKRMP
jgi:hypothetical protein